MYSSIRLISTRQSFDLNLAGTVVLAVVVVVVDGGDMYVWQCFLAALVCSARIGYV